jgi:ubiquinone/menaquinone biosynthesis C-methylase UbiE
MKQLKFTGERLTTEIFDGNAIRHLHRYAIVFDIIKDKVVLDIACGEGYGSNLMANYAKQVYGVDIDKESIAHACSKYKRDNLFFLIGDVVNIPIKDNSIDVIVSFETIEHHNKHDEMLMEFKRILKPTGIIIISSPDKHVYSELLGIRNEYHVKELYFDEFKSIIQKYFIFSNFYFQKEVFGSLLISDRESNLIEYVGDYNKIDCFTKPHEFTFNICICSNQKINFTLPNSYFNGYKVYLSEISELQKKINLLNHENFILNQKLSNRVFALLKKIHQFCKKIVMNLISK